MNIAQRALAQEGQIASKLNEKAPWENGALNARQARFKAIFDQDFPQKTMPERKQQNSDNSLSPSPTSFNRININSQFLLNKDQSNSNVDQQLKPNKLISGKTKIQKNTKALAGTLISTAAGVDGPMQKDAFTAFTLNAQSDYVKLNAQNIEVSPKLEKKKFLNQGKIKETNFQEMANDNSILRIQANNSQNSLNQSSLSGQIQAINDQADSQQLVVQEKQIAVANNSEGNTDQETTSQPTNLNDKVSSVTNNKSPKAVKYAKMVSPQQRKMYLEKQKIQAIKHKVIDNQYNLANYKASNPRLRVFLPGEQYNQIRNKPPEEREKIEQKRVDDYIAKIKSENVDYLRNQNQSGLPSIINEEQINMNYSSSRRSSHQHHPTAQQHQFNQQSSRKLVNINDLPGQIHTSSVNQPNSDSNNNNNNRNNYSVANSIQKISTDLVPFGSQHSLLQSADNPDAYALVPVIDSNEHVGDDLQKQLMSVRSLHHAGSSLISKKQLRAQSSVPLDIKSYLDKKKPELNNNNYNREEDFFNRNKSLSRNVKASTVSLRKVKNPSSIQQASKMIMETQKATEIRELKAVKDVLDIIKSSQSKQSAACTDKMYTSSSLMGNYDRFVKENRDNRFKAEDYFLIRNNQTDMYKDPNQKSDKPKNIELRRDLRITKKKQEVIHVTIDRNSLKQLTNLSQDELQDEKNVKLITSNASIGSNSAMQGSGDPTSINQSKPSVSQIQPNPISYSRQFVSPDHRFGIPIQRQTHQKFNEKRSMFQKMNGQDNSKPNNQFDEMLNEIAHGTHQSKYNTIYPAMTTGPSKAGEMSPPFAGDSNMDLVPIYGNNFQILDATPADAYLSKDVTHGNNTQYKNLTKGRESSPLNTQMIDSQPINESVELKQSLATGEYKTGQKSSQEQDQRVRAIVETNATGNRESEPQREETPLAIEYYDVTQIDRPSQKKRNSQQNLVGDRQNSNQNNADQQDQKGMINVNSTQLLKSVKASMNSQDFNEVQEANHNIQNGYQQDQKQQNMQEAGQKNRVTHNDELGSMDLSTLNLYNSETDPDLMDKLTRKHSELNFIQLQREAELRQILSMYGDQLTPAQKEGIRLDQKVQEINKDYQKINFGQEIYEEDIIGNGPKDPKIQDPSHPDYRVWRQQQINLKRIQLMEREEKFSKQMKAYKHEVANETTNVDETIQYGYNRNQATLLHGKESGGVVMLGSSPSQDFLVAPEVEVKVRNLLGRTELQGIANNARVLVEITDEVPGPEGQSLYHQSSLQASQMQMQARTQPLNPMKKQSSISIKEKK